MHLPADVSGTLSLTGLPDTDLRLAGFLAAARMARVSRVVILVQADEIARLAPPYAAELASGRLPFRIDHFPIRDFGIPDDMAGFVRCAQRTASALRYGEAVVVHCRGGIGRTGMMAQAVLVALGMTRQDAEQRIADAGSHCETAQQVAFLQQALAPSGAIRICTLRRWR